MSVLFETHRALLMSALEAKATRAFYSPFPEVPSGKIYGEHAKQEGERSFEALLGKLFPLYQPSDQGSVGAEESPFGFPLGITYPAATPQTLIDAAKLAGTRWANQTIEARVGVCLEALKRLNAESFLMAKAVENTTGQAFVMAFQAGGPHAQDRGLEAVAYAYDTMRTIPGAVRWEKPQGKRPPLVLDKTFHVVPRGVGLVIGCSTFPTWNSYPAIFANLATGNATIVKPHPGAILPLALTVKVIREVLAAEGQDPNTIILAADTAEAPVTMDYVESADIATIDFTGSSAFGATLRQSARGRPVFTEEAGVNPVIIAGTSDFAGICNNLAMSLSLYSGQMCTSPQTMFIPKGGIDTDEGHKSASAVAEAVAAALDSLLGDPARALTILGAIQSPATLERVASAQKRGRLIRASAPVPGAKPARTATPALVEVEEASDLWRSECFGPIGFFIEVADAGAAVDRAAELVRDKGAITALIHATDDHLIDKAAAALGAAGVPLSVNLTGPILVNQSAAFSDYHVTGLNPSGNATLTDLAYVARRFSVAIVRRPAAA